MTDSAGRFECNLQNGNAGSLLILQNRLCRFFSEIQHGSAHFGKATVNVLMFFQDGFDLLKQLSGRGGFLSHGLGESSCSKLKIGVDDRCWKSAASAVTGQQHLVIFKFLPPRIQFYSVPVLLLRVPARSARSFITAKKTGTKIRT